MTAAAIPRALDARARAESAALTRLIEPAQLRSLYQVALRRVEPVGRVYLWPATR